MQTGTQSVAPPAGVVIVDKPAGITSHDVVARVRRVFNTRKVGHAGTLDPMATGVLILGINAGTRILGHISGAHKSYRATIRLGASSSTDDREGQLGALTPARNISMEDVNVVLGRMRGEIMQRPSAVSAIKIDGRRAHARVRDGQTVEIPKRAVTIFSLEVVHTDQVGDFLDIEVVANVSSGTYIRAIARDLGDALSVGGHLTHLQRTSIGQFSCEDAVGLETLEESLEPWSAAISLEQVARGIWPCRSLNQADSLAVRWGQRLTWPEDLIDPIIALIDHNGELAAVAEKKEGRCAYLAVFPNDVKPPSSLQW